MRWQPSEPDGSTAYRQGHIPGAVYVSLEDEPITKRHRPGTAPAAHRAGCRGRRHAGGAFGRVPVVVATTTWNQAGSARVVVLTAAGLLGVRISTAAWQLGGRRRRWDTDVPGRRPAMCRVPHGDLYVGALPTLTAEQVAARVGTLLDARAPGTFPRRRRTGGPGCRPIPGRNLP